MDKRLHCLLQALLLLGMCIFLASKAANGQFTYYINQRFIPFNDPRNYLTGALAQTMFTEIKRSRRLAEEDEHDHGHAPASANLWFMLVPILIGVLIPARPLDLLLDHQGFQHQRASLVWIFQPTLRDRLAGKKCFGSDQAVQLRIRLLPNSQASRRR